jgi:hypothetical protein
MPSSRDESSPSAEEDAPDDTVSDVAVKLSDEEHDEFKYHLETLPKKLRSELLGQLRLQHKPNNDPLKTEPVARNLMTDYEVDKDKADDYAAFGKREEVPFSAEDEAAYVRIANARSLKGTIPAGKFSSGFEFTLTSRDSADISNARVILRKSERGKDAIQRKKTRDKVVQPLKPEISAGNISRILTSTDADDYDVAAEAISSQTILNAIHRFCIQYDMEPIIKIPVKIDLSNPLKVKASRTMNAIADWQQLDDKNYHDWQEFILTYGAAAELESNNWLEDTLLLSMDKTLRSEIESDMSMFPSNKCGAITMLRCIITRLVVKNQEAKDALESYIKDFDITNFPGENVPSACLRLKAIAKALGNDALPSNVIRKVLNGFAKSSTKAFNDVCSSQIAMRRATFFKDALKNISLQSQLVDVLHDLENTYLELVGGKQWHGIGHTGMNQGSSFLTSKDDGDDDNARALAAKLRIPWDEWVKTNGVCHFCGEKGHIRPKCPKYLADIASGRIKRNDMRDNTRSNSRKPNTPGNNNGKQKFNEKYKNSPKFKTLLAAFQAWSTEQNDDNNEEQVETPQDNDVDKEDDDEDAFGFFSALASLKE